MHALILEQDAWVALMIEDVLADLGYTSFDCAATGDEALALVSRKCPDLITSDVRLGASSGIETVRKICSDRYIPVVFVTSSGQEVHEQDEALPVVQKPFAPADLKQAVGQAVSGAPAP